jgi:hypothetical protein
VRGAAVLGGIVLALAAVLFLRYSIEHGLIPPIVRVAVGLLVGAGAIVASERLRQRGYLATANALAGAGVIILYASVWAARVLYELIGAGFAYVLMILVTVTCGLLSWRHAALEIAVLGLAGGFVTPMLLSTGSDNPIGLFAYVLMLDTGLLALARKRRWPVLMMMGLMATLFYQLGWILGRMGPDRYWLGLLILGTFSAFFILAANWGIKEAGESDEHGTWRMTQIAGVLLPFAFSLYFAANADLGPHLYPVAILIALLSATAGWLGRAQQFEMLPVGASAAAAGVYRDIKSDVCLSSISGGTDIVSCFVLGNPVLPVWRGEIQSKGLGLAVEVFDDDGKSLAGEKGELVCTKPFPAMPIGFWNDPDGSKYHAAYFDKYPNVWRHGDWCEITAHAGIVIYGRSDAVLNPGGVRIGTAEIYRQVESLEQVVESLVIGQDWQGDVRVVLFVKLREGLKLDDALVSKIKKRVRENTTPRHVPAKVLQVGDIPRTKSGKIVELAVRHVVHGRPVKNVEALANPEALEHFRDRAELAS